jgi:hypothetical protein
VSIQSEGWIAAKMMAKLPDFDNLPPVEGMPQGCAWGIFDKDGKKDLRGTLNLLTPDVVAAACKEARDGVSISLKYAVESVFQETHLADLAQLASECIQVSYAWADRSDAQGNDNS